MKRVVYWLSLSRSSSRKYRKPPWAWWIPSWPAPTAPPTAAVAVGTSIWLPAILFGHGLLLALTPVIAQLNGAGRRDRIAHQVRQGFWLASGVSVLLIVVLYNCKFVIDMMHNIDPQLADKAVGYLHAIMWERRVTCSSR